MTLILVFMCLSLWHDVVSETNDLKDEKNEAANLLQESIKKYGPPLPLNHTNYSLPGPQILTGEGRSLITDELRRDPSGNYTMKLRTINKDFSYTNRYEVGVAKVLGNTKDFIIKGQFTQMFRKGGGRYYLRTIGYISDKDGFYNEFLVDLSTVIITETDPDL